MIYLLDADTVIKVDNRYYPPKRFRPVWDWLEKSAVEGKIKIPIEQFEEILAGRGDLVDYLKQKEIRDSLVLVEDANPELVARVTYSGYAEDLNEAEIGQIGRDPFLISYGLADPANRKVVTFETRANKQRQNKKVPNVCDALGVGCIDFFQLLDELDYTM